MAKTKDQKKKLLYVKKILLEKTDEDHPLTTAQIIDELDKYDICSERKSIYTDIDALLDFKIDIINKKSTPPGYYVASREFEQVELKLLVDAVQSSRFITKKQTKEIIDKFKTLTNKYDAAKLEQRNVNISEPLKQTNNNSFIAVDHIHTAISMKSSVSFLYCDWNIKKEFKPRYDGKRYEVSPYSMTFNDGKYYMMAYDHASCSVRNYRVDKIDKIHIEEKDQKGQEEFKNFDLPKHSAQTFGMYNGEVGNVILQFKERLAGVMIDRFGTEPTMRALMSGDKYYGQLDAQINLEVAISPQFYGWVAALGGDVAIVGPEDVREGYKRHLESINSLYE